MSDNRLETITDCCLALAAERELGDDLATALVATILMATKNNVNEKAFLNALKAMEQYEEMREEWAL